MKISDEIKQKIKDEYDVYAATQYVGKTKKERQELGQFFTPPELSIQMLEKFDNIEGTILDPTIGAGRINSCSDYCRS